MMAKTATYSLIQSQTTSGSSTTVITFSSIPQTFTDLVLVVNGAAVSGGPDLKYTFNSDTGSNYARIAFYGSGAAAFVARDINQTGTNTGYLGTSNTTNILNVPDYSNTTTYKNIVGRIGGGNAYLGTWRSTAAISSITLTTVSSSYASGCTFKLYGIEAYK
jgi:hypothetical protein